MYEDEYEKLFITGRNGLASKIMHRLLEKKLDRVHFSRVLEVGANKGEHLPHVKHPFDEYIMTDIEDRIDQNQLNKRVSFSIQDVCDLQFPNDYFDRVIVTCVIQHVDYPERALNELLRVLKPGGNGRILLQSDSSLLFRLIRALTTLRFAKKANKLEDVQLFFAREHKNNYLNLITIAKFVYRDSKFKSLGWPVKIWPLEIFRILEFKKFSEQ
jgi:ubiquinone/menaquinone biosynthesis C-methylase UbiE